MGNGYQKCKAGCMKLETTQLAKVVADSIYWRFYVAAQTGYCFYLCHIGDRYPRDRFDHSNIAKARTGISWRKCERGFPNLWLAGGAVFFDAVRLGTAIGKFIGSIWETTGAADLAAGIRVGLFPVSFRAELN